MHVVLACNQQLPAKGYGGPQRVVVALVRGLAALGHRVTLLALPGSRVAEAALGGGPARKFGAAAGPPAPRPPGPGNPPPPPPPKPPPPPPCSPRRAALGPDDSPQPQARRAACSQQRVPLARPRPAPWERRLRLQRTRSRGLPVPPLPQARRAVRSVPRQAAQRQGLPLGGGSREAHRPPAGARRRLAAELHGGDQVRRRGGWRREGGAARPGALPVEPRAVGRAVRPRHGRGVALGDAGARHPARGAP